MVKVFTLLATLLAVSIFPPPTLGAFGFGSGDKDKVLLKDVSAITLRHGAMTTGRRSAPVPQLKCVGGSAYGKFTPQVVQCRNVGFDGQDVQVS